MTTPINSNDSLPNSFNSEGFCTHKEWEKITIRDVFEQLGNAEVIKALDVMNAATNRETDLNNNKAGNFSPEN